MKRSAPERSLESQLSAAGIAFVPELRFARETFDRDWRFDFAFPDAMLAVEVEGGAWTNGRHTRGAGFAGDCDKYNAATMLGWRVLRFLPAKVYSGEALAMIQEALLCK